MPLPIFVVDSSPAVRRLVEQISTQEGFEVVGFQDGPAALEAAKQTSPALIIADYHLDNMTFSGFCKEINKLDNLTETYLISLIHQADHLDENLLRTLGVKAFLKKPFQPDELLAVIKSLHQKQQQPANSIGLKRRAWPPTSTGTEDEKEGSSQFATISPGPAPSLSLNPAPKPVEPVITQPGPSLSAALGVALSSMPSPALKPAEPAMAQPTASPAVALGPRPSAAGPEDAMKGLFDQLLQSMAKQTEKRLADQLPRLIEEKLASQLRPIIQKEVRAQLGDILSEERLAAIIQPLLSRELPSVLGKEIANYEPIIRQTASDIAGTLINAQLDLWVRDQAEACIRKHLPDAIREQVGSIDQMVKDEMRAAVLKQSPLIADDIVRTTAERAIEQTVQRIVPELAEQHITTELKRLTASD